MIYYVCEFLSLSIQLDLGQTIHDGFLFYDVPGLSGILSFESFLNMDVYKCFVNMDIYKSVGLLNSW